MTAAATTTPEQTGTTDENTLELAYEAAVTAAPFADMLANYYVNIAAALRRGQDADALEALGHSTDDLEHFLRFQVLIRDLVALRDETLAQKLRDYHERLVTIIEGLQPALGHIDLVEVADALEDDLIPTLQEYNEFDEALQNALDQSA